MRFIIILSRKNVIKITKQILFSVQILHGFYFWHTVNLFLILYNYNAFYSSEGNKFFVTPVLDELLRNLYLQGKQKSPKKDYI